MIVILTWILTILSRIDSITAVAECSYDKLLQVPTRTTSHKSANNIRLPKHLIPLYYNVVLKPDIYTQDTSKFAYNGYTKICLKCVKPGDNITLHMDGLNIQSQHIKFSMYDPVPGSNVTAPRISDLRVDGTRQFLVVYLDDWLDVGHEYSLELRFTGKLTNDMSGFYYSQYEYKGTKEYIATTQLEPTNARKVFPCFDEPAIKSHFNVTLIRAKNVMSRSNMPRKSTIPLPDNMIADVYQTTPPMSTYLLAFLVGDLDQKKAVSQTDVELSTFTRKGKIGTASYALNVARAITTHYERYLQVNYPLPKLDLVAIPDFSMGGMENWGLILLREGNLFFDRDDTSRLDQQNIVSIITHELSHQWFGNLVTPAWWDDLWLKEGLASYMGLVGVDYAYPNWKIFDQYVVKEQHTALELDGLTSSHPVYVEVESPDDISEIYDQITYSKGAALVRMMKFFLGSVTFRLGLKQYLKINSYEAADHDHLWDALTWESSRSGRRVNVKEIMDTWILQMNYPVVKVNRLSRTTVSLTQERFLTDPCSTDSTQYKSPYGYKWDIPFTYSTNGELYFNQTRSDILWLYRKDDLRTVTVPFGVSKSCDCEWVIGNVHQYGYYRVNYDVANWLCIVKQLNSKHQDIPTLNRAQIIDDSWQLAIAGHISLELALHTLEYIHKELELIPRLAARKRMDFVEKMFFNTSLSEPWKDFVLTRVAGPFKILRMESQDAGHMETLLRSEVVSAACQYELRDCVSSAKAMFKNWMRNPANNTIEPDIRSTVYCTAVKVGNMDDWEFLFLQYRKTDVISEKQILLKTMACSTDLWLLERYLEAALQERHIRTQDSLSVFAYVASHSPSRRMTWDVIKKNWDAMYDKYSGSHGLAKMIEQVTNGMNSYEELNELEEFVKSHPSLGVTERAFKQSIEKTKSHIRWMNNNYGKLRKFLRQMKFY